MNKTFLKNLLCTMITTMVLTSPMTTFAATNEASIADKLETANQMKIAKTKALISDKVKSTITSKMSSASISTNSIGSYPTRNGVILVTGDAYKNLIPTGHAGIVLSASTVVESLDYGVTTGSNNWNIKCNTVYGVTATDTTTTQDNDAANWCYAQQGKKYNWNYFNISTRKSFYCSHLVWSAFKDLYGIDMNTSAYSSFLGNPIHPLELVNTSKTSLIYQK